MTTEAQWITDTSPASLLHTAKQLKVLKPRKSLLFACGCYRLVWAKIQLAGIKEAVEAAEERADRKISQEELSQRRYPPGNPARESADWYLQLCMFLTHCRSGGEHVRGCWVVDLLAVKS